MIVYDKEQKQIVIPNGLGNVNIVINQNPECPECNLEDKFVYPSMADRDENNFIIVNPSEGYDGMSRTVIDPQTIYNEGVEEGRNQGGGGDCNLEDKWTTPDIGNIDDNGFIVTIPSEGYDGMSRVVTDPSKLRESWYYEGYEQGRAECGGGGDCPECPDGDCNLITQLITQNGTYRASEGYQIGMLDFSRNGAFDSKLRITEDTYIELYFKFKDNLIDLMSFFGCEDNDWDNSTFAARYYVGLINVKMGSFERSFSVDEFDDGEIHKMKIGLKYGIEIDGQLLVTYDDIINEGIGFEPSATRTIYIGAINSPYVEDDGLNLFWRPFNGYIGPVTIYGKTEEEEWVTYNYIPGDYGWWGEYKILQTDQRIENINREQGAVTLTNGYYNPNADGFSEVTVNLPLGAKTININEKTRLEIAGWYGLAGFSEVNIDATGLYNRGNDDGKNLVNGSLGTLEVTNNGTYTTGVSEVSKDVFIFTNDTGAFVTDFTPILNDTAVNDGGFEIEVQAKVNSSEGGEKLILGCAKDRSFESEGSDTFNNVVLKANIDATSLFMSGCKTYNIPTTNDEWVTYRITENGLDYKRELQQEWAHIDWEGDVKPRDVWNSKSNDTPIAIGGLNTFYDGLFNEFQGSIRYVRFKQGDYDKTWVPSNNGQMMVEGTEQTISVQQGDTPQFTTENFKEGSYGWKKVIVNLAGNIGTLNYQEISLSDYTALGDNVDADTIYLIN